MALYPNPPKEYDSFLLAFSLDNWEHRYRLFCRNQGIYLDKYIQVTKH